MAGDLGDHPAAQDVAQEDVGVTGQADHALLDAGAARVVQSDDGSPVLDREILKLDHLCGMTQAEAASENGEILGEDIDQALVDGAVAGDHTVAHEIGFSAMHKSVEFPERPLIEQQVDPFVGGEFALGLLFLDAFCAAAEAGFGLQFSQAIDVGIHGIAHGNRRSEERVPMAGRGREQQDESRADDGRPRDATQRLLLIRKSN